MSLASRWFGQLALPAALLALAGPAAAVPQFTPSATALLHTVDSLESGATHNTGGLGVNGQVAYSSATQRLSVSGELDVMHYYDPLNGSCPTNAGSDCAFDFVPNLDILVEADFHSSLLTALGYGFFQLDVRFQSTGGTDILVTDPLDGDSVQLSGSWVAGTFQSFVTTGLVATIIYDGNLGTVLGSPTVLGFAELDATPFASLFDDGGSSEKILLNLSEVIDFSPSLDVLAAALIGSGVLPSFTAEEEGQIFRVASGDFVIPEPATALLLGLGLIGLGASGRRRNPS
jgi:hypothetical protein